MDNSGQSSCDFGDEKLKNKKQNIHKLETNQQEIQIKQHEVMAYSKQCKRQKLATTTENSETFKNINSSGFAAAISEKIAKSGDIGSILRYLQLSNQCKGTRVIPQHYTLITLKPSSIQKKNYGGRFLMKNEHVNLFMNNVLSLHQYGATFVPALSVPVKSNINSGMSWLHPAIDFDCIDKDILLLTMRNNEKYRWLHIPMEASDFRTQIERVIIETFPILDSCLYYWTKSEKSNGVHLQIFGVKCDYETLVKFYTIMNMKLSTYLLTFNLKIDQAMSSFFIPGLHKSGYASKVYVNFDDKFEDTSPGRSKQRKISGCFPLCFHPCKCELWHIQNNNTDHISNINTLKNISAFNNNEQQQNLRTPNDLPYDANLKSKSVNLIEKFSNDNSSFENDFTSCSLPTNTSCNTAHDENFNRSISTPTLTHVNQNCQEQKFSSHCLNERQIFTRNDSNLNFHDSILDNNFAQESNANLISDEPNINTFDITEFKSNNYKQINEYRKNVLICLSNRKFFHDSYLLKKYSIVYLLANSSNNEFYAMTILEFNLIPHIISLIDSLRECKSFDKLNNSNSSSGSHDSSSSNNNSSSASNNITSSDILYEKYYQKFDKNLLSKQEVNSLNVKSIASSSTANYSFSELACKYSPYTIDHFFFTLTLFLIECSEKFELLKIIYDTFHENEQLFKSSLYKNKVNNKIISKNTSHHVCSESQQVHCNIYSRSEFEFAKSTTFCKHKSLCDKIQYLAKKCVFSFILESNDNFGKIEYVNGIEELEKKFNKDLCKNVSIYHDLLINGSTFEISDLANSLLHLILWRKTHRFSNLIYTANNVRIGECNSFTDTFVKYFLREEFNCEVCDSFNINDDYVMNNMFSNVHTHNINCCFYKRNESDYSNKSSNNNSINEISLNSGSHIENNDVDQIKQLHVDSKNNSRKNDYEKSTRPTHFSERSCSSGISLKQCSSSSSLEKSFTEDKLTENFSNKRKFEEKRGEEEAAIHDINYCCNNICTCVKEDEDFGQIYKRKKINCMSSIEAQSQNNYRHSYKILKHTRELDHSLFFLYLLSIAFPYDGKKYWCLSHNPNWDTIASDTYTSAIIIQSVNAICDALSCVHMVNIPPSSYEYTTEKCLLNSKTVHKSHTSQQQEENLKYFFSRKRKLISLLNGLSSKQYFTKNVGHVCKKNEAQVYNSNEKLSTAFIVTKNQTVMHIASAVKIITIPCMRFSNMFKTSVSADRMVQVKNNFFKLLQFVSFVFQSTYCMYFNNNPLISTINNGDMPASIEDIVQQIHNCKSSNTLYYDLLDKLLILKDENILHTNRIQTPIPLKYTEYFSFQNFCDLLNIPAHISILYRTTFPFIAECDVNRFIRGIWALLELFQLPHRLHHFIKIITNILFERERKKALFIFSNEPNRGKTTLSQILKNLFDDCAVNLCFPVISCDKDSDSLNPSLVAASNKTICLIDEVPTAVVSTINASFKKPSNSDEYLHTTTSSTSNNSDCEVKHKNINKKSMVSSFKLRMLSSDMRGVLGYRYLYKNPEATSFNLSVCLFVNRLPAIDNVFEAEYRRFYGIELMKNFASVGKTNIEIKLKDAAIALEILSLIYFYSANNVSVNNVSEMNENSQRSEETCSRNVEPNQGPDHCIVRQYYDPAFLVSRCFFKEYQAVFPAFKRIPKDLSQVKPDSTLMALFKTYYSANVNEINNLSNLSASEHEKCFTDFFRLQQLYGFREQ